MVDMHTTNAHAHAHAHGHTTPTFDSSTPTWPVLGPLQCGNQNRFFKLANIVSRSSVNCTAMDVRAEELVGRPFYIRRCTTFMKRKFKKTFKEGRDGHITRIDSLFVNKCERGDVYRWLDYGLCCPGTDPLIQSVLSELVQPMEYTRCCDIGLIYMLRSYIADDMFKMVIC